MEGGGGKHKEWSGLLLSMPWEEIDCREGFPFASQLPLE